MTKPAIALVVGLSMVAICLVAPLTASAAESCAGVTLPAETKAFGTALVRNGVGVREATFLKVDVYVAGLYVSRKSRSVAELLKPETAKLMLLRFVRDLSRDDMVEALHEALRNNVGADYPAVKQRLQRFVTKLPQLSKGTTLSIAYQRGHGVELSVNGKSLGVDTDERFGNLLFRAWLGTKPPDQDLKAGLLGGPCE
jgi:hypothetical protein